MNVFFFTTNPSIDFPHNVAVIGALQKNGARIYSNLEGLTSSLELPKDIDALVVLGVGSSWDMSYVIALAIARNKPVLFLLARGQSVPEELSKISAGKSIKKLLTIAFFTPLKIGAVVQDFFDKKIVLENYYDIKFTLRLNREIDRYLQWKSKRLKKTKAKLVRQIIEDYAQADQGYKK